LHLYTFHSKSIFEHLTNKNKINFIDVLLLITTIQAGVGISTIYPTTHVFTLYSLTF